MPDGFLRKLSGFFPTNGDLSERVRSCAKRSLSFDRGYKFAEQGGEYRGVFLVRSGWTIRSKSVENGGRQIVNVVLPGDFIGLNRMLFGTSDFDLTARSPVEAYEFRAETLADLFASYPEFGAALFWMNTHEESLLAERIVSLGRRSAVERTAHVLCELVRRLQILDDMQASEIVVPLSQRDFADVLGLSVVHTNKTLRALEVDQVIVFRNEVLTVIDFEKLARIAGFDDGYLHFTERGGPLSRSLMEAR